jgi:hypothetical protein
MSQTPQGPQEPQKQPIETYATAFHTSFDMFNPEIQQEMSRLYSQIFAVLITNNLPYLASIVWMNSPDGFQKIYMESNTGEEVYKKIFDHFEIQYK